jgi:hypothetical protein
MGLGALIVGALILVFPFYAVMGFAGSILATVLIGFILQPESEYQAVTKLSLGFHNRLMGRCPRDEWGHFHWPTFKVKRAGSIRCFRPRWTNSFPSTISAG